MSGQCCLCDRDCDGSLMRMCPRFTRTRDWITAPEVPRLETGGIALCHFCQRKVYFAKGFINLLARSLQLQARYGNSGHWASITKFHRLARA